MSKAVFKLPSFFFILLYFFSMCCSGTHVGFSFDARRNKPITSPIETISFLRNNNVSPSEIRVFVTDDSDLGTLANSGVLVDLLLSESEVENLRKSNGSVTSWFKTHLLPHLTSINIQSIIVSSSSRNLVSQKHLSSLLVALKSVHSALKSLDLNNKVKVSVAFSLSMLEHSQRWHATDLHRVVDFIRKCRSFVLLETEINGALSMGDHFVGLMIKSAISSVNLLHYKDVPIVLNFKSSVVPSAVEVVEFSKRVMTCMKIHEHINHRIVWAYAQISPMKEAEHKELNREEEQIFHSSHRQLLDSKLYSVMKVYLHDTIDPPAPVTIPEANPVPTIVTVPATNPVTITPVNPTTNPVAVPATTPMTVPPTNPVTTPAAPVGNEAPPLLTVPMAPPAINNPAPPTGGIPITPPVATPTQNPVTPPAGINPPTTPSGQVWCVAKTGVPQTALQVALDYACGMGGADCSAIQQSGSCYNPNTPQNHASYAFNSYYQKHPAPSSCDFKGAATLVIANPSTGSCIYPSPSLSSSSPSLSPPLLPPPSVSPPATTISSPPPPPPPATTSLSPPTMTSPSPPTSSNMPPFMLNSTYPDPSTPTIFGSSPPPSSSTSISVATGLQPLLALIILVPFIVTGKLCRA